jgi:4-hydroxybenzoate polyprenyltransferase
MLKLFKIFFLMLRYRVAITLLMFFLLGITFNQKILNPNINYFLIPIALFSSYVAATTINDIVDKEIDKINHPTNKERPLVTGEATEKEMYLVHMIAVAIVLLIGLLTNLKILTVLVFSLIINYLYSLPPFKFSYKPYLAPITLSLAYVLIPYSFGVIASSSKIFSQEIIFIIGILLMFFGRIILKDFRDRKGDALYGKKTLLLVYGKKFVCALSFISIFLGSAMVLLIFPLKNFLILSLLFIYISIIFFLVYKLYKEDDNRKELFFISLGAKMGNGFLLSIIGELILLEYQAPIEIHIIFLLSLLFMFLSNFIILIKNPDYAISGYKG